MLAIIQARMSSRRLPGKVLKPLGGKPLLGWTIERLNQAATVSSIVVATSDNPDDDPLEAYCRYCEVLCHRGELDNVAARLGTVARSAQADAFVRICGDSPLIDPALIDAAVKLYEAHPCDLVTNVMPRTFPKGQSVEVIRSSTFDRALQLMASPELREHVTGAYYQHPSRYRIVSFLSGEDASGIQLAVDSPSDLAALERLIAVAGGRPGDWRSMVTILRQHGSA